jgi:hypothetical protein
MQAIVREVISAPSRGASQPRQPRGTHARRRHRAA